MRSGEQTAWKSIDVNARFDLEKLAEMLHLEAGSPEKAEFAEIVSRAEMIAKPKAFFRIDKVDEVTAEGANFGGVAFKGNMLVKRLSNGEAIFPYLASCGKEFDALDADREDPLVSFWLESLKATALNCAFKALEEEIFPLASKPFLNWMEPTDSHAWSIHELPGLFKLFPGMDQISLSEYMYMEPNKSRAGIFSGGDVKLLNCDHCAMRERCQRSCER